MLPLLLLLATLASTELPQLDLTPRNGVLRLAVTGDTGYGSEEVSKGIARVHAEAPLHGIVLTGDNFYPCGPKSVDDPRWRLARPLTRVGIPVYPVLGNHDHCGGVDPDVQIRATASLPNWRFPGRQYAARSALADFLFVDTTPLVKGRKNAVERTIRDAFEESKAPWRIVVGHHPVVSSGYHGYFPRIEVSRMREMIPALRAAKADLYICGHDHHVELLRGRMMHLVSGAGSKPIPPVKLRTTTVYPEEVRRERIGFAVLEITATRVRVRFYDGKGKARSPWIMGGSKLR
ncbi:MAG TPA: metallophosphoesterase [Thermoanaerobaculia bacterium]|nr:metallophosphoesterase [Thermoanaerobaculia bacterium]